MYCICSRVYYLIVLRWPAKLGGQLGWALCLSGNPPLCVLMLSVLQLYCCIVENKPSLSLSLSLCLSEIIVQRSWTLRIAAPYKSHAEFEVGPKDPLYNGIHSPLAPGLLHFGTSRRRCWAGGHSVHVPSSLYQTSTRQGTVYQLHNIRYGCITATAL